MAVAAGGGAYALALEIQLQELHAERQLEQDAVFALCLQLQPEDSASPYGDLAEEDVAKLVTSSCSQPAREKTVAPATLELSEWHVALSLLDEQIQALSQVLQAIRDSEVAEALQGVEQRQHTVVAHDEDFAKYLAAVPEHEWQDRGATYMRPMPVGVEGEKTVGSSISEPSVLDDCKLKGAIGSCAEKASSEEDDPNLTDCMICLESVPASGTCHPSLPLDVEAMPECSTSARASVCQHNICVCCAAEYIRNELKQHKYPIKCAIPGCMWAFGLDDVQEIVQGDAEQVALFQHLADEAGMENVVYCPYAQCDTVMDIPDPEGITNCVNCHRPFCASCRISWHAGYSCEEYQALPDHLRTAEDLQLLHLAQQKHWRQCPSCKHMVERNPDGCNFLLCRCRSAFCYQCGVAYVNQSPNANNQHGRPGCQCGLFKRPPPEPQVDDDDDIILRFQVDIQRQHGGNAGDHNLNMRQRVRRYDRMCRYGTLAACRHGAHRCWFRHEDE
eukprot:jgi/Chlat1/1744/Chrsp13S02172